MAGHIHGSNRNAAKCQGFAIIGQDIKLAGIGTKAAIKVKNLLKYFLHFSDMLTDDQLAAKCFFYMYSGRYMIGMGMGFYNINQRPTLLTHERYYLIDTSGIRTS